MRTQIELRRLDAARHPLLHHVQLHTLQELLLISCLLAHVFCVFETRKVELQNGAVFPFGLRHRLDRFSPLLLANHVKLLPRLLCQREWQPDLLVQVVDLTQNSLSLQLVHVELSLKRLFEADTVREHEQREPVAENVRYQG